MAAFAPHVTALQAAVAAAEADSRDAESVFRVASSRVLKHAMEMLAARAKGEIQLLDTAERRGERNSYTRLQRHKMREVFSSDAECDEQLKALTTSLEGYFQNIKRIYAHYSGGAMMSPSGFWAMVRDCKLTNKRLSPQKIDIICIRVNVDNRDDEGNVGDVDKLLTPSEFVEALVRMAHQRAPEAGKMIDKFESMMVDLVLPHACQSNSDEFRAALGTTDVRETFTRYRAPLRAIFVHYAALDNKGGREKLNCISMEEFLAFFNKADLTSIVSVVHARRIFGAVQIDDDVTEMIFTEFCEAIGALAQHADPNPYVPFSTRLDSFLRVTLIPNLLKSDAKIKDLVNPEGAIKGTGADAAAAMAAAKAVAERSVGFEKDLGDREKRVTKLKRHESLNKSGIKDTLGVGDDV